MRRSHDIFDAVIAAMTARAAALGQTIPPAGDDLAAATAEGWIVIPDISCLACSSAGSGPLLLDRSAIGSHFFRSWPTRSLR
jgi:hypothetical protein